MRRLWWVFAALFAAALLLLMPLRLVLAASGADAAGLSARSVAGPWWSGRLAAAGWRGAGLGDVAVRFAPLALLGGTVRYEVTGDQWRGAVRRGAGGGGVSGLEGRVMLGSIGAIPVQSLAFSGVEIGFTGGVCSAAVGQISVMPGGMLAGFGPLAGAPRCDGAGLLVPLVSADGAARVDLRLAGGGRFRADVMLDKVDESARAGLLAAGFQPVPQGLALKVEGVL